MTQDTEPTIRDDPENHRYVVEIDGEVVGFAEYHLRGGRHFFVHTEVDDEHTGRGLGTALVKGALDDVRAAGGAVVPLCPLVASYIKKHPEYGDLVDQEIVERIDRARERDD
ncbi:MAG: GNAT family N-acetyltransferase [Actinomycetota bacterium]